MKKGRLLTFLALALCAAVSLFLYGCGDILTEHVHEYTEWVITTTPTPETGGEATRKCPACLNEETVEIPALSDSDVWSVKSEQPATHLEEGLRTYTSEYGDVDIVLPATTEHEFGAWTITEEPTEETGGTARRECLCGEAEEQPLPALTDADTWTMEEVPADHHNTGSKTYTSEYGQVVVELPVVPHSYGAWTITDEPTEDETGTAYRECECGDREDAEVPALSDAETWTVDEVPADYNTAGHKTYTSEYGEITTATPKLVAPYDNKTYYSFAVQANDSGYRNRSLRIGDSWTPQFIVLDENGTGIGYGMPFNNKDKHTFAIIDPATGEAQLTTIDLAGDQLKDEDGTPLVDAFDRPLYDLNNTSGSPTVRRVYVDFETGFMVLANNGNDLSYVHVLTPYGKYDRESPALASAWGNDLEYAIAITYPYGDGLTESIFITDGRAYFGVTFEDIDGQPVAADKCYNNSYVYVKKNGVTLFAYGYGDGAMHKLDGNEGTYTLGEDTLTVSGYGTLEYKGNSGTYTVEGDIIAATVTEDDKEVYYEFTLEGDTYTVDKPMVEITFNLGGHGALADDVVTVNKNAAYDLPVPDEDPAFIFRGWFLDESFDTPVDEVFRPSGSVTLYAKWLAKVTIIVHVAEGDTRTLYLADGEMLSVVLEGLIEKTIDEDKGVYFVGWYSDEGYETEVPDNAQVSTEDDGFEIYAKWEALPDYYGDYVGWNLDGASNTSSSKYTASIDIYGNITSGRYNIDGAKVSHYDPATGIITANKGSSQPYLYLDPEYDIMATAYSTNRYLGSDIIFMAKYEMDPVKNIGIRVASKNPSSGTSQGYYVRIVLAKDKEGNDLLVFIYDDEIHGGVTIQDALGKTLEFDAIQNSKTLIVKLGDKILLSVSAVDATLKGSDTVPLDSWYGTYTGEGGNAVVDGAGSIQFYFEGAEVEGTYTAAEDADYTFDVYSDDGYYEVTLDKDGMTYTVNKPMVEITFNLGGVDAEYQSSTTVNKNVEITVAAPEEAGHVFRGWFTDPGFAEDSALATDEEGNYLFTPTETATLYAKWLVKVTITFTMNDGTDNAETLVYGEGETATFDDPRYKGFEFKGWFTDKDVWAEEWGTHDGETRSTSGVLNESVTVYAKWVEAPIYANLYHGAIISGNEDRTDGKTSVDVREFVVDIAADGTAYSVYSISPFRGEFRIEGYDEATGKMNMIFTYNNSDSEYIAVIDKVTGIIVMNGFSKTNLSGNDGYNFTYSYYLLSPFGDEIKSSEIASTYWNNGTTVVLTYTPAVGGSYNILLHKGEVYFGVTFKDGLTDDAGDVPAESANRAERIYVFDREGNEIFRSGFDSDSNTMVDLDGYEGSYTFASGSKDFGEIELNGVSTLTVKAQEGTSGVYAPVKGQEWTIDVYIEGDYYRFTLDTEARTYTNVKPMVDITFSSEVTAVDSANVNVNIPYELPAPDDTETKVFRGWYTDPDCQTAVTLDEDGLYVPTEDVTLYAKWLDKVTVTVVYGNTLPDGKIELGKGEAAHPEKPVYTEGKIFEAWYTTSDYQAGTEWTDGTAVESDITIYCKWMEAAPVYGEWVGANYYGTGNSNCSILSRESTLTFDAQGNCSGKKTGVFTDYDPETGKFKVGSTAGALDAKNGVLYVNYDSVGEPDDDIYIFVKKTMISSFNAMETSSASNLLGGLTKLADITLDDGSSFKVLYHDGRIYGNVSIEGTNVEGRTEAITCGNVHSVAQTLTVKDSDGNVIVEFERVSGALAVKTSD